MSYIQLSALVGK